MMNKEIGSVVLLKMGGANFTITSCLLIVMSQRAKI